MNFHIDTFIKEAKTKHFIELIQHIEIKLNWLDQVKLTPKCQYKDKEYLIKKYKDFIGEYLFFLKTGIKPAAMIDEDFPPYNNFLYTNSIQFSRAPSCYFSKNIANDT